MSARTNKNKFKNKFKVKRDKRNGDLRKANGDHELNASSDRYMCCAYLMESQVTWQWGGIFANGSCSPSILATASLRKVSYDASSRMAFIFIFYSPSSTQGQFVTNKTQSAFLHYIVICPVSDKTLLPWRRQWWFPEQPSIPPGQSFPLWSEARQWKHNFFSLVIFQQSCSLLS